MLVRVVALICGLLLTAGPAAAADWQPYVNREFGVSVSMPGEPIVKVASSDHRFLTAIAEDGNRAYMLRIDELGGTPADGLTLLNLTLDKVATPDHGPVVSRGELTIGGYPAVDLVIGPDADGDYIRARLIIRGAVLIQLLSIQTDPPPLDEFFTDVSVMPPAGGA